MDKNEAQKYSLNHKIQPQHQHQNTPDPNKMPPHPTRNLLPAMQQQIKISPCNPLPLVMLPPNLPLKPAKMPRGNPQRQHQLAELAPALHAHRFPPPSPAPLCPLQQQHIKRSRIPAIPPRHRRLGNGPADGQPAHDQVRVDGPVHHAELHRARVAAGPLVFLAEGAEVEAEAAVHLFGAGEELAELEVGGRAADSDDAVDEE